MTSYENSDDSGVLLASSASSAQVTELLFALGKGERDVLDRLMPLVYQELRRIARQRLSHERPEHTLNTTALVHEAYIKLVDQRHVRWQSRAHFYAVASMCMRRILVNHAKSRGRLKRGGGAITISLDQGLQVASPANTVEMVALDALLKRLTAIDERACKVVECRFFGGLTITETAEALGVAPMTIKRDWRLAKAWLHRELHNESSPDAGT